MPGPLGLAVHPTENLLYVDFVTISRIGIDRYKSHGKLEFLRTVPDSGVAPVGARQQGGTRLYASNTGDSSVSVYDISVDPTNRSRSSTSI